MAGAGYKLFNTGDVLTAAQVNTYLQEQTVMVFASSAARSSALSGVLAEGMVSYLQDTNAVEVYNGSAWVGVSGAGDVTEVQAGVGISVASGTGPIPVITNSSTDLITTAGDLLYGTAADTVARLGIGTAGQVLQVNSGATAPEWAAPASGTTFAGCYLYNSTNTTVASGTYTDLTFNSELYDTDGFHSTATNTDRITIPAGKAGYYLIMSMIQYDGSSTTGIRTSNLVINGSGISGTYSPGAPATATTSTYHVVRYLAVGDYVVLSAYQTSTTTITLNRDQNNTFLSVAYLGA